MPMVRVCILYDRFPSLLNCFVCSLLKNFIKYKKTIKPPKKCGRLLNVSPLVAVRSSCSFMFVRNRFVWVVACVEYGITSFHFQYPRE